MKKVLYDSNGTIVNIIECIPSIELTTENIDLMLVSEGYQDFIEEVLLTDLSFTNKQEIINAYFLKAKNKIVSTQYTPPLDYQLLDYEDGAQIGGIWDGVIFLPAQEIISRDKELISKVTSGTLTTEEGTELKDLLSIKLKDSELNYYELQILLRLERNLIDFF